MDQRAGDVGKRANPERRAERLEREVDVTRARLGELVVELERRGRQVRKPALVIAAVAGAVAVTGLIVYRVLRRRARPRRVQQMWQRAVKHPERVATKPPNVPLKIVGAAGSAAAAAGARFLMKRWLGEPRT